MYKKKKIKNKKIIKPVILFVNICSDSVDSSLFILIAPSNESESISSAYISATKLNSCNRCIGFSSMYDLMYNNDRAYSLQTKLPFAKSLLSNRSRNC